MPLQVLTCMSNAGLDQLMGIIMKTSYNSNCDIINMISISMCLYVKYTLYEVFH